MLDPKHSEGNPDPKATRPQHMKSMSAFAKNDSVIWGQTAPRGTSAPQNTLFCPATAGCTHRTNYHIHLIPPPFVHFGATWVRMVLTFGHHRPSQPLFGPRHGTQSNGRRESPKLFCISSYRLETRDPAVGVFHLTKTGPPWGD